MNYKIQVEGGFIGIPKTYEGEINLTSEEMSELQYLMKTSSKMDESLRDGVKYHVEINHMDEIFTVVFDDKNIPVILRKIVSGSL